MGAILLQPSSQAATHLLFVQLSPECEKLSLFAKILGKIGLTLEPIFKMFYYMLSAYINPPSVKGFPVEGWSVE